VTMTTEATGPLRAAGASPRTDADAMRTGRPHRRTDAGTTLAVAASGTLLVLAVFSAAVTSVGESGRALHAGIAGNTWTLSGMSLGLAIALLTVGAVADEHGRRRVLIWSSAVLAAGGALAAAAPDADVLIAARILQGLAGAGVLTASLGMIGHAFPSGAARSRAAAVWGAAVGAGIAVGPLAGAGIDAAGGWRSSYWVEAAAAAALVPAARRLRESRSDTPRPLDPFGAAVLAAAMGSLTAGLVQGRTSWSSPTTITLLAAGLLLLIGFIAIERRRRHPMVELNLFAQPLFVASIIGALFTGLAVIGLMSFSAPFMERALHIGVVGSALVLATWSGTSMVTSLAARRLPDRIPVHVRLAIGLALTAAGELALTGVGTSSTWRVFVPGLVIAGVGSGLANAALGRLAVESVPRDRVGMGSGANNTARYLGGAAGIALVVALASTGGDPVSGWDRAALVCAILCFAGAGIAALCRPRTVRA
jgi:MFS family permease